MSMADVARWSARAHRLSAAVVAVPALMFVASPVDAQSAWPSRQVRIVVPFAPGGDVLPVRSKRSRS